MVELESEVVPETLTLDSRFGPWLSGPEGRAGEWRSSDGLRVGFTGFTGPSEFFSFPRLPNYINTSELPPADFFFLPGSPVNQNLEQLPSEILTT